MAAHVTFWVVETRISHHAEPEAGEVVFECTPEGFARQVAGGLDATETETYRNEADALERAVGILQSLCDAITHERLHASFDLVRRKMYARAMKCRGWRWRYRKAHAEAGHL